MISVCIATYNGELYIEEQLNSILHQLSLNDEVIISDDSSTDKTLSIIKNYSDSRIKLLSGNKFKSPIFNIENAIKHTKGDIIILADQDDVWLPNRVSNTIELFDAKNCKLVFSNGYIVDENLNLSGKTLFEHRKPSSSVINNIIKNSFVGCCLAFTHDVKDVILPFPKKIPMHDQWIGILTCIFYDIQLYHNPQIFYRRHANNASYTGGKSKFGIIKQLMFRFAISYLLIKRVLKIIRIKGVHNYRIHRFI